jgi:uncharacterized membrane protein YoaK (UPF0700 family)
MFRHEGKGRTYAHNLKLASILSGVAGIVNIASVLELNTLTTNVTGHFALFSEQLVLKDYRMVSVYLFYILFFLLGAFVSSLIIEWTSKHNQHSSYFIPISIEIFILLGVSFSVYLLPIKQFQFSTILASALLFSMGLQNAVVRTTHLTGLFTDLGIELSRLFFYKELPEKTQLNRSIYLKLAIICCFFMGGIIGGILFRYIELKTLLIPVGLLLYVMWYDQLLFRYYKLKRKLRDHH